MNLREEQVLTSLLDSLEGLNISIHTFEILNNLGQVSLDFFDRAWVNQSANRSHCNHQHMPNAEKVIAHRDVHV